MADESRLQDKARDESNRREQPSRDSGYRGEREAWRGGYGEVSAGEPPRYVGNTPGYGSHGMGYGRQGGTQGGSFGVYGVPRDLMNDYTATSREGSPREFDQPHGRVGFGWSGSFGSAGEHSARSESVAPRTQGGEMRSEWHRSHEGGRSQEADRAQMRRRAPKNYRRSDQRVYEDVCEALGTTPRIDASDVTVEVKDGTVTLYGTVPHRQMKHWIEDLVADCPGVHDVENKLNVALVAGF